MLKKTKAAWYTGNSHDNYPSNLPALNFNYQGKNVIIYNTHTYPYYEYVCAFDSARYVFNGTNLATDQSTHVTIGYLRNAGYDYWYTYYDSNWSAGSAASISLSDIVYCNYDIIDTTNNTIWRPSDKVVGGWRNNLVKYRVPDRLNYPANLPSLPQDVQKYILIYQAADGSIRIESLEKKGFSYINNELNSTTSPDFELDYSYILSSGSWNTVSQLSINAISISTQPSAFDHIVWCNHDILNSNGSLYRASDAVYGYWK